MLTAEFKQPFDMLSKFIMNANEEDALGSEKTSAEHPPNSD